MTNFRGSLLSSTGYAHVERENGHFKVQNHQHVSDDLLAKNAEGRKRNARAPLGDSHGGWQKIADVPFSLLMSKIPPDAWEDQAALAKLLNDPEIRAFRCDGDHRRF